jgi:hypothetical protein
MRLLKLLSVFAGAAVVFSSPTIGRSAEMCDPWTTTLQVGPTVVCLSYEVRTEQCEEAAPSEVLETCNVCASIECEYESTIYYWDCWAQHAECTPLR